MKHVVVSKALHQWPNSGSAKTMKENSDSGRSEKPCLDGREVLQTGQAVYDAHQTRMGSALFPITRGPG